MEARDNPGESPGRRRDESIRGTGFGAFLATAVGFVAAISTTAPATAVHAGAATPGLGDLQSPSVTCWQRVSSPNPGTTNNLLNAVAAVSSNDVWAVGSYRNNSGSSHTLIEHWGGAEWSADPGPDAGTHSTLNGVAAVSGTDVWAVGDYGDGTATQTLLEHWNGTGWSVVPGANVGTAFSSLHGVAAASAADVWAVGLYGDQPGQGQPLIEHWNGTDWTIVPSPVFSSLFNSLDGVAAVSATDLWAVGYHLDQSLVEHWNGTEWNTVPSPGPGIQGNHLWGVKAISATDVWAVGWYSDGAVHLLAEHWNGAEWSVVPSPGPSADNRGQFYGVAAVSTSDVWAVGDYEGATTQMLVEHWNGAEWSMVPSTSPGARYNYLYGVTALSGTDLWAAGTVWDAEATGPRETLVERPGTCLPTSPTPTSSPFPLTATPTPARCPGQAFSDVCPDDYFYPVVMYLFNHGIISGYADGTFRPYNNTTRGQMAKIVVIAKGWSIATPGTPTFTDVPPDHPFYQYVETAVGHNVVSGYADGTFRPGSDVTRGQLCKIVVLAEGWPAYTPPSSYTFRDVHPDHPFFGYVETAYAHGIISGYLCGTGCLEFRPGNNATRAQIAKIVYLAITNPVALP